MSLLSLQKVITYRELLRAFTLRNIKIKYKQTFMGFLWALFMPTMILISGIVVKSALAMISGRDLDLTQISAVLVKTLPWSFFIGTLKFSVASLSGNMIFVSKIYFPRVIIPMSYIFSQLFDFFIACFFFTLVLIFINIGVSVHLLWLPLILICLLLLTSGLALLLACGNLFYRDVRYIVDVILMFAIFFTPVFYEANTFPKYEFWLRINPIGSLLEALYSVVVLHQAPLMNWTLYFVVWSVGIFSLGWYVFHKAEPLYADNI